MASNKRTKKLLEALQERSSDPFAVKEGRFSFGRLKDSFYRSAWVEESFLSDNSRKEMVTRSFNFSKLKLFLVFGILAIFILITRAAWLQVIKSEYYYLLSEDNRLRQEVIEPKRGIIYDRNFNALVRNKANFVLYLRPIDLPRDELKRDGLIREVSMVLSGLEKNTEGDKMELTSGKTVNFKQDNEYFYKIKELLSTVKIGSLESYQPLFIVDNIDYEIAMKLNLEISKWPGVFVSNKIRREYLVSKNNEAAVATSTSLSHLLGYTGKINTEEYDKLGSNYSVLDYIGKVGLEYFWESDLKGSPGKKNIEVDALGRMKKAINEEPAHDGHNLLLSIDLELQQKTEEILRAHLEKNKIEKASIIIMDPNNGEILTMISWPFYNNNDFATGINTENYQDLLNNPNQPLFNRAVSGEFPSGSTIKPIFAAGALQEGVISENTSFLSNGGLWIGQWFFPDWRAGGHGMTNVRSAIANSVNTFFYYIGGGYGDFIGLGLDGLVKYSNLFGLGEKTGIDMSGEASGFVPTREWKEETKNEAWYIGDTYHFAIGQGDVLATPLQVANYTATLANGGTLYKPRLVSKILDSSNNVIEDVKPEIIRENFIDSYNMNVVREGMRQTVTIGSGRYLNSLPVEVAAKTGTAQWSSVKDTHAWFIGFAPYDNPELAFAILLEEGGEGSTTAAPIAYDILKWYFQERNQVDNN
ncbi:MAG TPA: penicillin-binding protein 2 [Patescibacteria group bacterium]|nr:penicillin-binding protein 2 [Patescibacteria group bacterium]